MDANQESSSPGEGFLARIGHIVEVSMQRFDQLNSRRQQIVLTASVVGLLYSSEVVIAELSHLPIHARTVHAAVLATALAVRTEEEPLS